MRPGVASSSSPGRVTGRVLRSAPLTVIWLASCGGAVGPAATSGAPLPPATCGGAVGGVGAAVCDEAGGGGRTTRGFARGLGRLATTVTGGSMIADLLSPALGGDVVWASAVASTHSANMTPHATARTSQTPPGCRPRL